LFSGLAHPVSVGLKLSRRYFRRLGEKKFAARKPQGFLFFARGCGLKACCWWWANFAPFLCAAWLAYGLSFQDRKVLLFWSDYCLLIDRLFMTTYSDSIQHKHGP
jgi:hypothetical protein